MGHYCIDLIDKQWQVIYFFLDNKERKRKLNLSGPPSTDRVNFPSRCSGMFVENHTFTGDSVMEFPFRYPLK